MNTTPLPAPSLPPGRPNLIITGFMGTGKTTVGAQVAQRLRMPFLDLDRRQERIAGMPIVRIFDELGEPAFREIERRAMREAAALSGAVIACGGAAPLHRNEYQALTNGAIAVVLAATPEEIERRIGDGTSRPMLAGDTGARIRSLQAERAETYAAAGERIDTTDRGAEDVADAVAAWYLRRADPTAPVRIDVGGDHGPVMIGAGTLDELGVMLTRTVPEASVAVLAFDPNAGQAAERCAETIATAGLRVHRIKLPSGEDAKSADSLAAIWTEVREARASLADVLIAVGGGAALDAAGFAAATYARGIPLVNVPTTTLAMVDASLGGKTAVDHAGVKNLVGAFHPPRLVVADPTVLDTLPDRERRTGMAEVVKAGVLASPLLPDAIDGAPIDWVIEQAVRIKAAYVAADPRDVGVRRSLNLGHTFAHAIEAVTGFGVPHGEAVACGLIAAARLGVRHAVTEEALPDQLAGVLRGLDLPTSPPTGLDPEALADAMLADKKRRGNRAVFVVPAEGGAALLEDVDPRTAIEELLVEATT